MCGELLGKAGLHVVDHRHSVVPTQQNSGESRLFDGMNARVCTGAKARQKRQCEWDVQQDLLHRKAYRNALESKRICRPHQAHARYLNVAANRIREEIDRISELAEPLNHLANRNRGPPILVEWLGCDN